MEAWKPEDAISVPKAQEAELSVQISAQIKNQKHVAQDGQSGRVETGTEVSGYVQDSLYWLLRTRKWQPAIDLIIADFYRGFC